MRFEQQTIEIMDVGRELGAKWGWFVALGAVLIALGVLALGNLIASTIATVYYVGIIMVLGALAGIVQAFQVRNWSGFLWWLFGSFIYLAAGIVTFRNPLLAASVLTLVLAFSLLASGSMRIWTSLQMKPLWGWGWIAFSGALSLLAGIVFLMGWPINTLWLLGMMLAVDLTFQGIATIAFGLTLKSGA